MKSMEKGEGTLNLCKVSGQMNHFTQGLCGIRCWCAQHSCKRLLGLPRRVHDASWWEILFRYLFRFLVPRDRRPLTFCCKLRNNATSLSWLTLVSTCAVGAINFVWKTILCQWYLPNDFIPKIDDCISSGTANPIIYIHWPGSSLLTFA
jgi:hypothetical protein